MRELAFLNKGIRIILNDLSKKKLKSNELKFYCAWQWEGEKIIGTESFFDTAIIQKEMALYQEKMNSE